jgi:hypothetical protein
MPQDGRMCVPQLAGAGWHRSDKLRRLESADWHRSDRPRRGWSAVVLGVAGVLAGALAGAAPAAAAGTESLTLNPDAGRPTAPFAADYRFYPPLLACPTVQFTWDGRALKKVTPQHRSKMSDPCVARLAAIPPVSDRAPGQHLVGAGTLSAAYTIVPGPTSSARPSPTPTRTSATRQPTGGATDDAVAGGVDTSQAAVAPLATGAPSVADAASGGSSGGGLMSWILIFGGLLVLGGITIFGLLLYWTRRGGPGDYDADTQVIGE